MKASAIANTRSERRSSSGGVRSTLHFAALWKHEANVHLIKTAFAVMLTGRLYHDPASSYSTKAFVKLRYMRSYHSSPAYLEIGFQAAFPSPILQ